MIYIAKKNWKWAQECIIEKFIYSSSEFWWQYAKRIEYERRYENTLLHSITNHTKKKKKQSE